MSASEQGFARDSGDEFAAAIRKQEIDRVLAEAILHHQAGRLEKAAEAYQRVLAADSRNHIALNNFSLMLDDDVALDLLRSALDCSPDYADALINSSLRWMQKGNLEIAFSFALRAQQVAPEEPRIAKLLRLFPLETAASARKPQKGGQGSPPPLFSIIIPTHRRASLLSRALASIQQQTLSDRHEIIVVSDCVDSATESVCQQWLRPTDTFIRRSGSAGPSASRNVALQLAKGQNVLFLDDDDAWHPELLASLQDCAPLNKGQSVFFNCTVVKETRTINGAERLSETFLDTSELLDKGVFIKNQVHLSCFATPRVLLQDLLFDHHMRAYEDWDFLLFLIERQMPIHVPILGSVVHEVDDSTSDRRGSSSAAKDFNAVLDYLYIYRRHPVDADLQEKRAALLRSVGLVLDAHLL